jgi:signal recognition particle GTPase
VLLTGFAGTGKSTTIATVIKSLSHKMITIATPTHKAAAVLSAMLETNGIISPKRQSDHNTQSTRQTSAKTKQRHNAFY